MRRVVWVVVIGNKPECALHQQTRIKPRAPYGTEGFDGVLEKPPPLYRDAYFYVECPVSIWLCMETHGDMAAYLHSPPRLRLAHSNLSSIT